MGIRDEEVELGGDGGGGRDTATIGRIFVATYLSSSGAV